MPEIHNPKVIGDLTLTKAPSDPSHGVRLQDLDARAPVKPAFVADIVPSGSGIVAQKVYAPTVPANKLLVSAVSDTENVRVTVLAQGALFLAPNVTVNGTAIANFTAVAGGNDLFQGTADIVMAESGDITVESDTGATYTVTLTVATEGPVISTATIGAYPGSQTEAKAGDVMPITGVVANGAVSIAVANSGAAASGNISTFGANDSAGAGFKTFSGTFVVANRTGSQAVSLTAQNALGTDGAVKVSDNSITLNQAVPTISTISVNYPNGQAALTIGDTAQVSATVTGADSVSYSFSAAGQDASITDPEVYAVSKDVTLNNGTYFVTNNYTVTATKASNGAVASRQGIIKIAEAAATATISILGNPSRLRSSEAGNAYTLRVQPNQELASEPVVVLAAGEFSGNWSFAGGVYSRQVLIRDSDARGVTAVDATLTNLANAESPANGNFTIGGFVERAITFDAFARFMAIGTSVVDFTKVRARYNGQGTDLTRRSDTTDVAAAFTIVNSGGVFDANGTHLFLNDAAFAGSNTSGTLQVLVEETL
ncbi:tail sheath [Pseudomonas phage PaBG]|uniref:Uncharacterized protein n=1 Tax=Pseudomonas phage PaBG TaxID=1335230 RepID=S5WB55_9CAUD|nr:tail sheath [Pseudomonas phage PaBG]AGS81978.1 tail assembly protein [Pseudomonas phage PaBG]